MPLYWKLEMVIEGVGSSSPEGFDVLNVSDIIQFNLNEEDILRGGKAEYPWAVTPCNLKFIYTGVCS